jgi:hypothetical protein
MTQGRREQSDAARLDPVFTMCNAKGGGWTNPSFNYPIAPPADLSQARSLMQSCAGKMDCILICRTPFKVFIAPGVARQPSVVPCRRPVTL